VILHLRFVDAYKFYYLKKQYTLDEIYNKLISNSSKLQEKKIFGTEKQLIDTKYLTRATYDVEQKQDNISGSFRFDKLVWGYNEKDEYVSFIHKANSQFCFLNYHDKTWLVQFPTSKGRAELKWYLKETFEVRGLVQTYKFPLTMIEDLKEKYVWPPYVEEIPQHEQYASRVKWIRKRVDQDPIFKLTRARGSPSVVGILYVAQNDWMIEISPSGTIKCFQDPYYESFIKFVKNLIMHFF